MTKFEEIQAHEIKPDDLLHFEMQVGGEIVEIEETPEPPRFVRFASTVGKYDMLFDRLKMNGGGLKVPTKKACGIIATALSTYLKRHKKEGRAREEKRGDGDYRVYWVSKGDDPCPSK